MLLLETLAAMTAEERGAFGRFLASPFFMHGVRNHRPENLLGLFLFLEKNTGGAADGFDREAAYQLLFPEKKYAEATVNALASELHRLLREFIAARAARAFLEERKRLAVARFYKEKGMEKAFLKTIGQLSEDLSAMPPAAKGLDFYHLRYETELETCLFESARNPRGGDSNLGAVLHGLDLFYAAAKLEYSANLLTLGRMVMLEGGGPLPVAELLPMFERAPFEGEGGISCLQKAVAFLLAKSDDERAAAFAGFDENLRRFEAELPADKLKLLYAYERIFANRQLQSGDAGQLPRLFGLYKKHLAGGFLFEKDGSLIPSVAQNMVRVALKLGEADWADQFLTENRGRICAAAGGEEAWQFNMACLHFHKKDWPGTLRHLQLRYDDNYYALHANLLELKLYYERRNWELLDNKLNSFKVNIFKKSKQWLPAEGHAVINRFVDLLRQMMNDRVQVGRDSGAIGRIRAKVEGLGSGVAERDWLLEKLGELDRGG